MLERVHPENSKITLYGMAALKAKLVGPRSIFLNNETYAALAVQQYGYRQYEGEVVKGVGEKFIEESDTYYFTDWLPTDKVIVVGCDDVVMKDFANEDVY